MTPCPAIEDLEELLLADDRKTIKHAEGCSACQAVLALLVDRDDRERSAEFEAGASACAEVELLTVKRRVATLTAKESAAIDAHLEGCAGCRLLDADADAD